MKKPLVKEAEIKECSCCKLSQTTIDTLNNNICSINAPSLDDELSVYGYNTICSECKSAILEEVWDNVIKHPNTTKRLFGFDMKSYITNFIEKNKYEMGRISNDYLLVVIAIDYLRSKLTEFQTLNKSADSITKGRPVPTLKQIHDLVTEATTHGDMFVQLDAHLNHLTKENADFILDDEAISALVNVHDDMYVVVLSAEVPLIYEEPATIRIPVICVDERKANKPINETTEQVPYGGFKID